MSPETLEALKGSIEKWRKIVEKIGEDHGTQNCPLCRLFHSDYREEDDCCAGCPVHEHTELSLCMGTPYDNYTENPSTKNANAELEFLRSLLPKEAGE